MVPSPVGGGPRPGFYSREPVRADRFRDSRAYPCSRPVGHNTVGLLMASPGRLVGRATGERDLWDVAEFEAAAIDLLQADVMLLSDAVLSNAHVSDDLLNASPV